MNKNLIPAKWWRSGERNRVKCLLCPRQCVIAKNHSGFCEVRKNIGGRLYTLSYARPVALQVDHIEKKPLAEFLPGSYTFSLGTYGCNLDCSFCQNYHLSRGSYADTQTTEQVSAAEVISLAKQHSCRSIAFTYNEPAVFAEYILEVAQLARQNDLATVMVTNGYISPDAAAELYPLIDAANIDMKGFSESFYREMTGAQLQPVLDNIKLFHSCGGHLELTTLIIPGKNDIPGMIDDYFDWLEQEIGLEAILHFSAYHPDYKYNASPPTPASQLYAIREKALNRGFRRVYLGNIL